MNLFLNQHPESGDLYDKTDTGCSPGRSPADLNAKGKKQFINTRLPLYSRVAWLITQGKVAVWLHEIIKLYVCVL